MKNQRTKFAVLMTAVMAVASPLLAQAQTTEDDQLWVTYLASGLFAKNSPYGWQAEVQNRLRDDYSKQDLLLGRAGLSYQVNPNLVTSVSYQRMTFRTARGSFDENRLILQANVTEEFGKFRFLSRTRYEARDLEDDPETASRVRQLIRVTHPIPVARFSAFAATEYFWNLDRTARQSTEGYAQNRTQIGIATPLSPTLTLETSLMRQRTRNTATPIDNDNLVVTLSQRF